MSAIGLGSRLSRWLALQSMVGLGLVCGTLYLGFDWTLEQRRHETLAQKEAAVRDLLAESSETHRPEAIPHLLQDMLAGHGDLGMRLVDGQGRIVFSRLLPAAVTSRAPTHHFQLNVSGGAMPSQVTLQLDPSADRELLNRVAWLLFVAALCGTVAISLGGRLLVRRSLAPLHQLVAQTSQMMPYTQVGDPQSHRLDGRAQPAELQPLIAQFNALLDRLSASYTQMEAFNADVAHELNTPLATMISGSHLALRQATSKEELHELLGSHLEELNRLAHIVADMLFLSRAQRGSGARRAAIPSLNALVSEVAEFHEAALADANLSLRIEGDAAAAVDAGLVQRAVSNLLGNATRHARSGTEVLLRIQPFSTDSTQITVENVGDPIAPDNISRIFDRFFRAEASRSQADRHHGLGLAIVAAIAKLHGGGTVARSQAGRTSIGLWLANMTKASSAGSAS